MEKFSQNVPCLEVEEEKEEEEVEEDRDKETAEWKENWEKELKEGWEEWEKMLEDEVREDGEEEEEEEDYWDEEVVDKDSSGRDIFVEAGLPKTNLKKNSLASILGETDCHYFEATY